jgi:ABC-type glutathione transport system ATPase component
LHQKVSEAEAAARTLQMFEKVKLPNPERNFESLSTPTLRWAKAKGNDCYGDEWRSPKPLLPTNLLPALDVTVQKTILELMNDLEEGNQQFIVFITHDLGVIAEVADRVIVMYKGKNLEQGTVTNVLKNPQHPYTKRFVGL